MAESYRSYFESESIPLDTLVDRKASEIVMPANLLDLASMVSDMIDDDVVKQIELVALKEDPNGDHHPYREILRWLQLHRKKKKGSQIHERLRRLGLGSSLIFGLLPGLAGKAHIDSDLLYSICVIMAVICLSRYIYPMVLAAANNEEIMRHQIPKEIEPLVETLVAVYRQQHHNTEKGHGHETPKMRLLLAKLQIQAEAHKAGQQGFELETGTARYRIDQDGVEPRAVKIQRIYVPEPENHTASDDEAIAEEEADRRKRKAVIRAQEPQR